MIARPLRIVLGIAIVLGLAPTAWAVPFHSLEISATAQTAGPVADGGGTSDTGTVVGGASPLDQAVTQGPATAHAAVFYGTNRASGVVGTVGPTLSSSRADAAAKWTDVWLITGGIGGGTLTVGVHLSGNVALAGGNASINYVLEIANDAINPGTQVAHASADSSTGPVKPIWDDDLGGQLSFTYGVPLYVRSTLQVHAFALTDASATSDFISTAVLDVLILPQGAILETESGATIPVPQSDDGPRVPAPAALALLGAGVLALAARRPRA